MWEKLFFLANTITDGGTGVNEIEQLVNQCGGVDILRIIKFVWSLLDILFIIVPIGLILMITVDFGKNVIAGKEDEMKKNVSLVIKRLIFCVVLFLIPTIVKIVINVLGDSGIEVLSYAQCITVARTQDLSKFESLDPIEEYPLKEPNFSKDNNMQAVPDDEIDNSNNGGDNSGNNGNTNIEEKRAIVLVGDSRTAGIKGALSEDYIKDKNLSFVSKIGEGYDWLSSTGFIGANRLLRDNSKKYSLVFWLGVNDLYNQNRYLEFYNSLVGTYDNVKIVVVSVSPTTSPYTFVESDNRIIDHNEFNNKIIAFNNGLKKGLNGSIKYCNIYHKVNVVSNGDGLHYNNDTYKKIMEEIEKCL